MNKFAHLFLVAAASIATGCATKQTAPAAPISAAPEVVSSNPVAADTTSPDPRAAAVAPVMDDAAAAAAESKNADRVSAGRNNKTVLASLSTGTAPQATMKDKWKDLDESTRHLLIMGTADGFSAAGAGAPCFPGEDNGKLDAKLKASGFDNKDPATLAEKLAEFSASRASCATAPRRGYTTDLIRGMNDEHLATYLTGVVRGYSAVKPCPIDNHGYAAAAVATALFALDTSKEPIAAISAALAAGCAFKGE